MTLRPSRPDDAGAIRSVLTAAFPTEGEADLVDALRADGHILLEWVTEVNGQIVGAIQYSPLILARDDGTDRRAAALAPVAVLPDRQNRGLGGQLIEATLAALRQADDLDAVVVLGHPDYYPRFGFSADAARTALVDPFDAGAAFMAMALRPGGLEGGPARPIYAPAFGLQASDA